MNIKKTEKSVVKKKHECERNDRICGLLSSRDTALQLVNELEWSKRELQLEVCLRKKIEKVLKKSYLSLKSAVSAEQAANRSKSEFLATMSHEIRTPLNSISGFLTLLKQTALSPDQTEYLNIVRGASEGLLLLINDILDISRIEAGHLELEPVPFNLYDLLGEICETVAIQAHIKGLELNWQIKKGTPVDLRGDSVRLRQVLFNLLGNAVRFTGSGEVFLFAEQSGVDEGFVRLGFSVSDTGIGVSDNDRQKIFHSFRQADGEASAARDFGGSGLGLYISAKIIELMGGEIGVRDNGDTGSVFYFTVNLERGNDEKERDPQKPFKYKILVAGGVARTRKVLRDELECRGAVVIDAERPESIIRLKADAERLKFPFRVILLDTGAGGTDLSEIVSMIKAEKMSPDNFIMLVSSCEPGNRNKLFRETGLTGWLVKPVRPDLLWKALEPFSGDIVPLNAAVRLPAEKVREKSVKERARILLADDNRDNQIIVRKYLEKYNYDLCVVGNGREAVEAVRMNKFALVLMDINMPVMDGYQAAREMRKSEAGANVPIVALTALVFREDIEKCRKAGMDDYILKPFRVNEFIKKIREVLKERGEWPAQ